jgi:hypothetical protein
MACAGSPTRLGPFEQPGPRAGIDEPMNTALVEHPFEDGPPCWVQRSVGQLHLQRGTPSVGRCAFLTIAVGWVPLFVLTILQGITTNPGAIHAFLMEFGAHARYLIAAPLLVVAEGYCAPRLSAAVEHFLGAGLVPEEERGRFEAIVASTRGLLKRTGPDIAIVVFAYVAVALTAASYGAADLPVWHRSAGLMPLYSPAGWWHALVSMPLLLILLLRWGWRLALWTRLLWCIAQLDLRLVAAHPDHAAGLGFVGNSVRAFDIVVLAVSTIAAGRSAHFVMLSGTFPTPNLYFNVGFLFAVMAVFIAPLLVFAPRLFRAREEGELAYGALARRVGAAFEGKWVDRGSKIDRTTLDVRDFSATADLNAVVANVYEIRFIPIDLLDVAILLGALLLPFVPVVLLAVPMDVLWSMVRGLML